MLAAAEVAIPILTIAVCVLLAIGLANPVLLWRLMPFLSADEPNRKRPSLILGTLLIGLIAIDGVILAQPSFDVSVPAATQVIAGESTGLKVAVENSGIRQGTYRAEYALDGVRQSEVAVQVPGSDTRYLMLDLPIGLTAGSHTILLGDTTLSIRALRPAAFSVTSLTSDTRLAKTGERVTVVASVLNTGEVSGEFDGVLKADGRRWDAQPTTLGPGEEQTLAYTYRSARQAKHYLCLGDKTCSQIVVRPLRFENGHFLCRDANGGEGTLEIKNGNRIGGVVVLTRQSGGRLPVVACYVAPHQSFTIAGIPDGRYWIYYTLGRDWNTYTDGFLETKKRARFQGPADYSTKTWTNYWNDSMYRYSQGHVQYTRYSITLNPVLGGTGRTEDVSENAFPRVH